MKKSLVLVLGFVIALTAAPFVEKGVAADKITLGIAISQTGRYAEARRTYGELLQSVRGSDERQGWVERQENRFNHDG